MPDYKKLAEESGGSLVDLAKQYGGTVVPGQTPLTAEQSARLGTVQAPGQGDPNFFRDAAVSIPSNLGAAARGVVGGAAGPVTMLADPLTMLINPILKELGLPEQLPPSQGLAVILDKLGVPRAQTRAQEIMQGAVAGMAGGAENVVVGGALKALPGAAGRVGSAMAAQPASQVVGGASGGAAAESAAQLGAPPLVQLGAGVLGGAVGGATGNTEVVPSPRADMIATSKATGVPVMTSDVIPPKSSLGEWVQTVTEIIGTGSMRTSQQAKRVAKVNDLLQQYGAGEPGPVADLVMQDLKGKRAADLATWTGQKDEVLQKLSRPVPKDPVVRSIGSQPQTQSERIKDLATLEMNKVITPEQQAELDRLRAAPTSNAVPMTSTNKKVDESIAYLEGLSPEINAPAIKALQTWKKAVQNQDLANVEDLRSQIGEVFQALKPQGQADATTVADKVLMGIYGKVDDKGMPVDGIRKDMADYIKANGSQADLNKWLVANRNLSDMMGELQLSALKRALNKGDVTPELVKSLLLSKDPSTVVALARNLTPKGQQSARAAILADAAFNAEGDLVTPDKFRSNMRKFSSDKGGQQVQAFFKGEDLSAVEGVVKVLGYTQRAGLDKAKAPTGIRGALMLPVSFAALNGVLGGGKEGAMWAVGGGLTIGGLARLYESPAGRAVFTRLAQLKPGSNEEQAAIRGVLAAVESGKAPEEPKREAKPGSVKSQAKPVQFGEQNPGPMFSQGGRLTSSSDFYPQQ